MVAWGPGCGRLVMRHPVAQDLRKCARQRNEAGWGNRHSSAPEAPWAGVMALSNAAEQQWCTRPQQLTLCSL